MASPGLVKLYIERLTAKGYDIFPLCPHPREHGHMRNGELIPCSSSGKLPFMKGWQSEDLQVAPDLNWKKRGWDCGIGIRTGGQLLVVDIDNKDERDGIGNLVKLFDEHGDTFAVQAETPSGGFHSFFRMPDGIFAPPNTVGKPEGRGRGLCYGVDTRGDRGNVVVSPTTTANGKYKWLCELPHVNDLPIAPSWMIEKLEKVDNKEPKIITDAERRKWRKQYGNDYGSSSVYDPGLRRIWEQDIMLFIRAQSGENNPILHDLMVLCGRICSNGNGDPDLMVADLRLANTHKTPPHTWEKFEYTTRLDGSGGYQYGLRHKPFKNRIKEQAQERAAQG